MQPLRRLTAIVLNVLLIQVSLAGDRATCIERGEPMASPVGAAAGTSHDAGESRQTDGACPDRPAGEECAPPWAPVGWADPALTRQARRPAPDLPPPRA